LKMDTYAQSKNYLQLNMSTGISTPMPKFRFQPMFAGLGSYYEGGFDYFFGRVGLTTSGGIVYHPTDRLFKNFINTRYNASANQILSSKWETTYGLLGLVYKLGKNKLEFDITGKVGVSQISVPAMAYVKSFEQSSLELFSFYGETKNQWQPTWSSGVRIAYKLSDLAGLQLKGEFIGSTNSKKSLYTNSYVDIQDRNKNGSLENAEYFESPKYTSTGNINMQAVNIGIGLVFQLERPSPTPAKRMFAEIPEEDRPDLEKEVLVNEGIAIDAHTPKKAEPKSDIINTLKIEEEVKPVQVQTTPFVKISEDLVSKSSDYIAPESTYDAEGANFLYKAGESYFAGNDFESAMPCFNKLKADPLYPHAKYMFAMTLSEMGNCDEAKKEYEEFESNYIGDDARTFKIIFKSRIEKCKTILKPNHEDIVAGNIANGVSYKIQFIAMKQSNATFPKLAGMNDIGNEFLPASGIYRYNLETYFDLDHATKDMYKVRQMGFRDAFIAVYNDGKRVDTLHHAK
jgi:tetratricopeptide (TPR) repeat protein